MKLNELQEGQLARIESVHTSGSIRRRLFDLGMIEGTVIECIQKSPYGDPVAFGVRGATIALRSEDSQTICICPIS